MPDNTGAVRIACRTQCTVTIIRVCRLIVKLIFFACQLAVRVIRGGRGDSFAASAQSAAGCKSGCIIRKSIRKVIPCHFGDIMGAVIGIIEGCTSAGGILFYQFSGASHKIFFVNIHFIQKLLQKIYFLLARLF